MVRRARAALDSAAHSRVIACSSIYKTPALNDRMANRSALRNALGDALKHFSRAKLCQDLMEAGVPAGPVNTVAEAMQQAHASARDMLIERPDYRGIGLPIKLSGTPGQVGCRPPRLGEHNDEIIKNRPS
jgi:crotonobetainyl-CoA:carnitine CoA-transferase CaiB-like acyl-CoA transferase